MTFATEKLKASSSRFMFVRMEPRRLLQASVYSGFVYVADLDIEPTSLFVFDYEVPDRVNSTPTLSSEWYYDSVAKKVYFFHSGGTPIATVRFRFYFTGEHEREAYKTPTDNTSGLTTWTPKIIDYPAFTQSVENILSGVFSISDLTLQIDNSDNALNSYFTEFDSWYQTDVDIWLSVNSQIMKIYTGLVSSVSVNNSISFQILDQSNKLTQECTMGDNVGECYLRSQDYPNLLPSDEGKIIPFIASRYSKRSYNRILSTNFRTYFRPSNNTALNRAYCSNYNQTITTSNNRTWIACRAKSFRKQSFGTITAVFVSGTGHYINVKLSSYSGLYIGQPVRWVESSVTYYGTLVLVGPFTESSVNYDIRIFPDIYNAGIRPFTTSSTFTPNYSMSVHLRTTDTQSGDTSNERSFFSYPLQEGRDYTVSESTTANNNKTLSIILTSNAEANVNSNTIAANANLGSVSQFYLVHVQ